jgi:hypothetical protein
MYKLNQNSVTRLADGASIPLADGNRDYQEYKQWLLDGGVPEPEFTEAELAQQLEDAKPKVLTPRQARLALLGAGLYDQVNLAVKANPAHEIYWEYALEVKRDDALLIELSTALGITSTQLDELFVAGSEL